MEVIEKYRITIEDLAKKHGKGQQAIRNYIDRYEELQGHYKRENGSTWLDETAVAFIESKIKPKKPDVAVFNAALEEKIRELQEKLIEAQEKNVQLLEDNQRLYLEATEQKTLLLAATSDFEEQLKEAQETAEDLQLQLETETQAADDLRREHQATKEALEREKEETRKAWAVKDRFEEELEKAAELNAALQTKTEEQAAELEILKKRGFWARVFNKG